MMRTVASIRGMSLALVASVCCIGPAMGANPEVAAKQLGKQIADFTLRDYRGKPRSLKEFEGKPVAVIFIGADCPLAKLYAPRLEQIYTVSKRMTCTTT